jgi:hypothetical protein
MSLARGFHSRLILLFTLAGMYLLAPPSASAHPSEQEKQRIAAALATEINRSIAAHQNEGITLREKVIGRLFQCGDIFIAISKQADDPDTTGVFTVL